MHSILTEMHLPPVEQAALATAEEERIRQAGEVAHPTLALQIVSFASQSRQSARTFLYRA